MFRDNLINLPSIFTLVLNPHTQHSLSKACHPPKSVSFDFIGKDLNIFFYVTGRQCTRREGIEAVQLHTQVRGETLARPPRPQPHSATSVDLLTLIYIVIVSQYFSFI